MLNKFIKISILLAVLFLPLNVKSSGIFTGSYHNVVWEQYGDANFNNTYNGYTNNSVGTTGTTNLLLRIPDTEVSIVKIELYIIAETGAALTNRNIDFNANISHEGQAYNNRVASDTTSTYNLSACGDILCAIDLTTLLNGVVASDAVGLTVTQNAVGGNIHWIGFKLYYKI